MVKDQVRDVFGVLTFDDTLKTYALDGQHRLTAINNLINETPHEAPAGFSDEKISVIFVVPSEDTTRDEFLKSYRRLFSSLNRHAKPTDENTNIIMDEDDRFAIVTRRLFSECDFFKWDGLDENPRIDTTRTNESLTAGSSAYATLIALYRMNITLLWDPELQEDEQTYKKDHQLLQNTPSDAEVDELYEYLDKIWDAILINLPDLYKAPSVMRRAGANGEDGLEDNLLFRPLG